MKPDRGATTIATKSKWKPVDIEKDVLMDLSSRGFSGFEELHDYEVLKEPSEGKRQGKKLVAARKRPIRDEKAGKRKKPRRETPASVEVEPGNAAAVDDVDMSAWLNCFVPPVVLKALAELGFTKPTEIQALTLPSAIRDHMDIMGAAETGSGKTLAFGIPILHHILERKARTPPEAKRRPLYALVLTPTRELAIQVSSHLKAAAKHADVRIVNVVGGLSAEKQLRLLRRRPEIVVATPGRLWELFEQNAPHLRKMEEVRYLVVDEADRMVEKGHFEDLAKILEVLNAATPDGVKRRRQNFVFSATLTLVHDLPKRLKNRSKKHKLTEREKLEQLMQKIGTSGKPKIVDITRKLGTVETLSESRIVCPSSEEKDCRLYYFLLAHPGRTVVFCNSIDCVRRLRSVLELLGCNPLGLHASMQQRQRLRHLDRFRGDPKGLLLATDVAARGLDIPGIEHVIHFQVPRTAEIYVHRSGRTARALSAGLSVMLVEPKELPCYRKICHTLNREEDLPDFPIDIDILKSARERVLLARQLESESHRKKRRSYENNWFRRTAKEMDIELDESLVDDVEEEQTAKERRKLSAMRSQLQKLLKKPLFPTGFSGRYLTQQGELMLPKVVGEESALKVVERASKKKWRKKVVDAKLSSKALKVKQKLRRLKKKRDSSSTAPGGAAANSE